MRQFCHTTKFFQKETHLLTLSRKSGKTSVEHSFSDVIRLRLNNDNKKGLTLQTFFFLLSFSNIYIIFVSSNRPEFQDRVKSAIYHGSTWPWMAASDREKWTKSIKLCRNFKINLEDKSLIYLLLSIEILNLLLKIFDKIQMILIMMKTCFSNNRKTWLNSC